MNQSGAAVDMIKSVFVDFTASWAYLHLTCLHVLSPLFEIESIVAGFALKVEQI